MTDVRDVLAIELKERCFICLILCIAVILLALSGIRLTGTVGKIVGVFELITEQLNFIGQQVDAVRQGIQGIQ